MIRRPPRSTLSSSSAASDVYKRQVFDYVRIGKDKRRIRFSCITKVEITSLYMEEVSNNLRNDRIKFINCFKLIQSACVFCRAQRRQYYVIKKSLLMGYV